MSTIGEIFQAGMTAVGYDTNSPAFVEFLNQPAVMNKEITPENALTELRAHFLTYKDALTNPTLKATIQKEINDEFRGAIHGKHMEIIEKALVSKLKDAGVYTDEFGALLTANGDLSTKINMALDKVKGTGTGKPKEDAEKLREALEATKGQMLQLQQAQEAAITAATNPLREEIAQRDNALLRVNISQSVRGKLTFINDDIEKMGINSALDSLSNTYHIKHEGGEINLYQKDNPELRATDPETAVPLKFNEVFESVVPKSLLKTQNADPGTGTKFRVNSTESGEPEAVDTSKMNPARRAAYEKSQAKTAQINAAQ